MEDDFPSPWGCRSAIAATSRKKEKPPVVVSRMAFLRFCLPEASASIRLPKPARC